MSVKKKIHEPYNGDARKMIPSDFYDYSKSLSENVERLKNGLSTLINGIDPVIYPYPRKLLKGLHYDEINYAEELKELAPIDIDNFHIIAIDWKLEDEDCFDIRRAERDCGYRSDEEFQDIKRKLLNQEQAPVVPVGAAAMSANPIDDIIYGINQMNLNNGLFTTNRNPEIPYPTQPIDFGNYNMIGNEMTSEEEVLNSIFNFYNQKYGGIPYNPVYNNN